MLLPCCSSWAGVNPPPWMHTEMGRVSQPRRQSAHLSNLLSAPPPSTMVKGFVSLRHPQGSSGSCPAEALSASVPTIPSHLCCSPQGSGASILSASGSRAELLEGQFPTVPSSASYPTRASSQRGAPFCVPSPPLSPSWHPPPRAHMWSSVMLGGKHMDLANIISISNKNQAVGKDPGTRGGRGGRRGGERRGGTL